MKTLILSFVCLTHSIIAFSQDSINCQFFLGKNKIYFQLNNTSNDTIRMSLNSLYYNFWNSPTPNEDFMMSGDTFYILLAYIDHEIIQSNGELLNYQKYGERAHHEVLPGESYAFYLKIKGINKKASHIRNIFIISNWPLPPIHSVRLMNNSIPLKFKPIKPWLKN